MGTGLEVQAAVEDSTVRRTFCDLSEDQIHDAEESLLLRHPLFGKRLHWEDILQSRLILLVSEAQSGKSYECHARQEALWAEGRPAFLIELAAVAMQPWAELRSPEETERLDAWRRSSDIATIFLDSVDELKLTQGNFRAALRNVANDLAGQMSRVRVVLTSRPLPIDRALFIKTFAAPTMTSALTEDEFASLAMGDKKSSVTDNAVPDIRIVALLPLSQRDVATIAADRGVTNTVAFLEALTAASMIDFMKRPQDVIEAASSWLELGGKFGTHAQQVQFDIKARLKANPERGDRDIANDKALEGAKRLALAVVLTRRLTIRHDVNHDTANFDPALDPTIILADWDDADRKAILERGLFGFASYGRVRFHNRLAFEFLAAARIADLLDKGLSRQAVRRLLVIKTAQGSEVLRPSLQDVAAWLALRHDWVFDLVNALDPSLLMNLGDPGSLSVEQRAKVLAAFIEGFGRGGWRGLSVPEIQIHRFADQSLGQIITREFISVENPEVRQVLLDLIAYAKVTDGAPIARSTVHDPAIHIYERIDALDALIALDDSELATIADDLRTPPGPWDQRFSRVVLYRLFPKWMTVEQLLAALAWVAETKSVGSELSRNLPRLVEGLVPEQLEALRIGLTPLVEQGLRFDKNRHAIINDRPHLVHLLAKVTAMLMINTALKPEAARSTVVAAELARLIRSKDDIPASLFDAMAEADASLRAAIFAANAMLLRELRPDCPRLNLFLDMIWRGALQVTPADDKWLRRMLGDPAASPDLRAAALNAEVFALAPGGKEQHPYLAALRPLVADDSELTKALEDRLTPHVQSAQERRWATKHKWRERQDRRRSAKAKAKWVMFWRELKDDPDRAFSPKRAVNTARNLYRAMSAGARRPESGWNRTLIEDHFGKCVADRLHEALMPIWRRQQLQLPSERPEEERNTYYESWVLALTAIAAEAEDPKWLDRINADEVETAIRYVPLHHSGFPPWLDPLAARHPDSVDRLLGQELSWELALPASAHGWSITLQKISNAAPPLALLFLPRLRAWLDSNSGLHSADDNVDGAARRLEQVTNVLLKFGNEADRKSLGNLAAATLTRGTDEWYADVLVPILFAVDPNQAVERLEAICEGVPVTRHSEAVKWFGKLFGHHHRGRGVSLTHAAMTPDLLMRLLRLAYTHVERVEDNEHEGTYSPDMRDDAEAARDSLLNAIIELSGPEGWAAKHRIASEPEFAHIRDRLHTLAMEKSAAEADNLPMSATEVAKFDRLNEPGPRSPAEMFALMIDRIADLRDHLLSDVSPRELWASTEDEHLLRRAIAAWLTSQARGAYTIAQEGVTAEEKETDIRLRSTVNNVEGVIELKVGDKPYSGNKLAETITDQLVAKYLAPAGRRAGVLLVTRAKRTSWKHPDTDALLDFAALIAMLRKVSHAYREKYPEELHIDAAGLDLSPRLLTERDAKQR